VKDLSSWVSITKLHCLQQDLADRQSSYEPLVNSDKALPAHEQSRSGPKSSLQIIRGNLFRALLVVVLCLVAIAEVDMLDKIVSLLGAFLGIPLAFIFPFLIHLRLVDSSTWVKMANTVCAGIGVCLALTCSAITLATWNG